MRIAETESNRVIEWWCALVVGAFLCAGCGSRPNDATYLKQVAQIEHEYKQGSDKASTFPNLDRKAPPAEQRKVMSEDLTVEAAHVSGLVQQLRALNPPPKYKKIQDTKLELLEGDIRCEREWAEALRTDDKKTLALYPAKLLETELTASQRMLDAYKDAHIDVAASQEQLNKSRATFESLEKGAKVTN